MASNAIDGDAAKLSEVQFTVTPSAVELSASEEERLRTLGLERRSGVPGLYLMRAVNNWGIAWPVGPAEEIKLEGELKVPSRPRIPRRGAAPSCRRRRVPYRRASVLLAESTAGGRRAAAAYV